MVCLATAHPAKFCSVVEDAINILPEVPEALSGITQMESRCELMDVDKKIIQEFISKNALYL
jgi:threonine synthase